MGIFGKVLAAPFRLLDLPNKVMKVLAGDDRDETILDKVAESVEKAVDRIVESPKKE
jgi:hypothetical protein